MSDVPENGDWGENRKLVLRTLSDLQESYAENEYNSRERHDTVVKMISNLGKTYVTHKEFSPIAKVVYGIMALFLTGTVTAILGLVLTAASK